jgi:hypothetical protein
MIFVKLPNKCFLNVDEFAWIDLQARCPETGSDRVACVRFGGRIDEALELSQDQLNEFQRLGVRNGYMVTFGDRYVINLQKVTHIQILRGPKVKIFFGFVSRRADEGSVTLEGKPAEDFVEKHAAYLNLG